MKPADRDHAIDRALPHALRAGSARASDACPDAETVAAWTARTLPPAERESLDTHLADCARCQALLAAFARAEPEPAPSSSPWATWRLPWLIPVATAATALAIWVATPARPPAEFARTPETQESAARERADDVSTRPPATPDSAQSRAEADRNARVGQAAGTSLRDQAVAQRAESPAAKANANSQAGDAIEDRRAARAADQASPPAADAQANRVLEERIATAAPPAAVTAAPSAARAAEAPAAAPAVPQAADAAVGRREAFQATARAVELPQIVSPDPAVRWRIVGGNRVERSTSGGATWTPVEVASAAPLTAGASPDPQICWLVGGAGTVRLATDGVQFRVVPFPEPVDLVGVRATSAQGAVVTTVDGRSFRTDDRGATWSVVPR